MGLGRLTPLQTRVLSLLAGFDPPFALTGGGALAAVHLGHRATRDLDLFWHGRAQLDGLEDELERRLHGFGLVLTPVQRRPSFVRFRVSDGQETVVLDLVADPSDVIEAPIAMSVEGGTVLVDTRHEVLVNKLCALLGRSEVRDLVDVEALLEAGGDLPRALRDAPRKDAGFSPLTLAHVLRGLRVGQLAVETAIPARDAVALEGFRDRLIDALIAAENSPRGT